jgi:hypothetical protein
MAKDLQSIDRLTMLGWGMVLMPVLTMWHEIGGHAAACVVQGGHVATLGAFYVECTGLPRLAEIIVACAGVAMNVLLAVIAFLLWRGARTDGLRLILWLVWVSEAFVASGYFLFSGVSGVGDLGTTADGALHGVPAPLMLRVAEVLIGAVCYVALVRAAIGTLTAMLGTGAATSVARRAIAHVYYATCGGAAVLVGLLNPVGIFITIMSAAASSFGGLAGFISIGYATPGGDEPYPFRIARSWPVIMLGALVLIGFALILGPSRHFAGSR